MSTPDADPNDTVDTRQTVVTPPPGPPVGGNPTIDLRATRPSTVAPRSSTVPTQPSGAPVIDLRDGAVPSLASATVLVPPQSGPPVPPPQPVEVVRFGPGVPAVLATPLAVEAPAVRKLNRNHALNWVLTLALAAVVVWLLWPAGALHVRGISVKANPTVVSCNSSADVTATVTTNGNAGHLKYHWIRNNGSGSGTLVQSVARGQHHVQLHLTWTFRGPGTYGAQATVQLLTPGAPSATVSFRYTC